MTLTLTQWSPDTALCPGAELTTAHIIILATLSHSVTFTARPATTPTTPTTPTTTANMRTIRGEEAETFLCPETCTDTIILLALCLLYSTTYYVNSINLRSIQDY